MNIQYWNYVEQLFEQLSEKSATYSVERQFKLCHFVSRRHFECKKTRIGFLILEGVCY